MSYVSIPQPLGKGRVRESLPPRRPNLVLGALSLALPQRVRGWRRMTFQTTYPSEIFQRSKVLTQSPPPPPSEMTFKAPLENLDYVGGGGGKGGGPDLKDMLNCAAIL